MQAVPRHLAIIMDGNGRWAQRRRRPRFFGHIKGARVARQVITECARRGVQYLTLYAFSTENWKRPETEVSFLMKLLERHLIRERQQLIDENICFHVVGDVGRLPLSVRTELLKTKEATKNNSGMQLTFALNYGGRQEIVAAVKRLASMVKVGELRIEDIDEGVFAKALEGSYQPDPDLIIRTSGESRLSNFLTWQSSYSEFFVTPVLWPDFTASELERAFEDFAGRERRFGSVGSEVVARS